MSRKPSLRPTALAALVASVLSFTPPPPAQAGCGCTKPAPAPAAVRPNVTYGGQAVTLFHSSLVNGGSYTVNFTAMNGTTSSVTGTAVNKRDLADAVYKNQLSVAIPTSLPLGPVGITVTQAGQSAPFLSIPDTSFTVAPQPVAIPNNPGTYSYQSYKAAIGRDGKAYISLDLTGNYMPRTIKAVAKGYPLRFTKDNAIFYNVQGFLMQLVNAPIPGLATITAGSTSDSDILQYQRHEFNTYLLQHAEHLPHSVDPNDANWHSDGSRHIDHDHLILSIAGKVNGVTPAAGSTPAFTLQIDAYTFFYNGLVGLSDLVLNSSAITDSYNSKTSSSGASGDILSNAQITINDKAVVNGNATANSYLINGSGKITGKKTTIGTQTQFIPVAIPKDITNLGDVTVASGTRRVITAGSYLVSQILINSTGELRIDNSNGPVTIYSTGMVQVNTGGKITTATTDPEKFAVYVSGASAVQIDAGSSFYGVVYAPQSDVRLNSNGTFYGSFIGNYVTLNNGGKVHFDTALRGE